MKSGDINRLTPPLLFVIRTHNVRSSDLSRQRRPGISDQRYINTGPVINNVCLFPGDAANDGWLYQDYLTMTNK